jgi:hypothetical protein
VYKDQGPATGYSNGLHPKNNFLAINSKILFLNEIVQLNQTKHIKHMKNKNSRDNMVLGLRLLTAGALLTGTTAYASGSWGFTAGNPSSPSLTQSYLAQQRLIDMMLKTAPHAAVGGNEWFQNPSIFAEYSYNATEDTRPAGGFDTDINGGTVGLNFMTKCDIAAGMMFNYNSTTGDKSYDADNFGVTLSLAKSYSWFFMGLSTGYDNGDSTSGGPDTDTDAYTLAPFIGAIYVKGNFSFSTAPTLVMRWQDFDTAGVSTDSSDISFGLMNTASYQVTEAFTVSVMANWNCVVDEDLAPGTAAADHNWFSFGTKLNYRLKDKFAVYASYMIDVGSHTYDNQRATAGLSLDF